MQVLEKLLVVIARGGAGAIHMAGSLSVGGGEPVMAEIHEGVKVAQERRLAQEAAPHDEDGVLAVDVAFEVFEHTAHHRVAAIDVGVILGRRCMAFVVFARLLFVGTAFLGVVCADFAFVLLGVFALVGLELPLDLVGSMGHEGHPEGVVEFQGGIAEHLVGFAHDRCTAFGDAVAMVTEIGIHGIGLLGGNPYDFVTVLLPHLTDGVCAGLLIRGALGERNEVVDLGGGCRGVVVTHGRTPSEVVVCPP